MIPRIQKIFQSQFVRNSLIYFLGAICLRGVGFFLLPLYTSVLTPQDYGELELINTFISITSTVLSFGLAQVIFIEYYHVSGGFRKNLIREVSAIYVIIASPLFVLVVAGMYILRQSIFGLGVSHTILLLAAIASYVVFFQSIYFSVLKISQRAVSLTVNQIAIGVGTALLNVYLVYYVRAGVLGIIFTNFFITLLSATYALFEYKRNKLDLSVKIDLKRLKYYLRLGLPFVPGAIAAWMISAGDRWILLYNLGEHDVGIYSVAYKFASMYQVLLIVPAIDAYMPHSFKKFASGDLNQQLKVQIPVILITFVLLGFVTRFGARFLIGKTFYDALGYIPLMVMSQGLYFCGQIVAMKFLYFRKVDLLVFISIAGAVINLGMNLLLVPKLGIVGSIISSIVTNLLTIVLYVAFMRSIEEISKMRLNVAGRN